MKRLFGLAALAICAAAETVGAAESVDAIIKTLEAASAKVTSVTCMQRATMDSQIPDKRSLRSEVSGALEYERSGGKTKWREESKGFQIQKAAGQESRMEVDTIKFDDGDHTWIVIQSGGKTTAFKLQMRETRPVLADKTFFDALRADNSLVLKGDEVVEGQKCIVLDATPKTFTGKVKPGEAVMRYWILPDSGVIAKIVAHDMQARPQVTTTRTQIKTGVAIAAERFKPPPGAGIQDTAQ